MCDKVEKGVKAVHNLIKLLYNAQVADVNVDVLDLFRTNIERNYDVPKHVSGKDKTSADFNGKFKSQALIDIEKKSGPVKRGDITDEHIIPLAVSVNHLLDNYHSDTANLEKLEEDLGYCINTCAVTKDEDNALTAAGLRTSMPNGWKWGDDPFARYKAVGIVPIENIKKQDIWTVKIWYENEVRTECLTRDSLKEKFDWTALPDPFYTIDKTFHTRIIPGIVGFQVLSKGSKRVN